EIFAERPVRIMRGHARIDHIGEHVLVITYLEFLRKWIEAELLNELDDSIVPTFEVRNAIFAGHGKKRSRGVLACAVFAQKRFERGPDVFLFLNLDGLEV